MSTPRDSVAVMAVGDRFVSSELLESALRRYLTPVASIVTVIRHDVEWPDVPLGFSDEVHEFVGDPDAIAGLATECDALVTHVGPVTQAMLERCPRLRIVGCCRGGAVNINVAAATARHIPVVNSPGRNAQAVIEFTLGLILCERRGIARAHAALSQGEWEGYLYRYDRAGLELQGQTIGLVGFGAIAQGLTPYLKPFGVRILTFDPYVSDQRLAELGVTRVDLPELLRESDVVSLHARVTPETRHMIGAAELAQMKPTATLVNTARGPLVDYDALYAALVQGTIAGAALDCLESEPPPPDWPLLRLPNVTVTPHIAGASRASAERGAEQVAEDVGNFFAGRPLLRCINPTWQTRA